MTILLWVLTQLKIQAASSPSTQHCMESRASNGESSGFTSGTPAPFIRVFLFPLSHWTAYLPLALISSCILKDIAVPITKRTSLGFRTGWEEQPSRNSDAPTT